MNVLLSAKSIGCAGRGENKYYEIVVDERQVIQKGRVSLPTQNGGGVVRGKQANMEPLDTVERS